jgi:hypothetical protein
MRAALIENGVVVNVSIPADGQALPAGWVYCEPEVGPGWAYESGAFAPPPRPPGPTPEEAIAALRAERNARLSASDWTQVADAPVDAAAWAAYRQALRDMPENTADPLAPVWPAQPV